ncbi:cytochrome c oxidase subunit 6b-2 [Sitophilus oryzae]|uniref:Cytochrome c oxidase subunit 6b-2 n=1 Tax=Sitophilus oryzae TaxID=7048 RepID=A0A6J2XPF3_SITOR|nr:cytochrome c oxidase subunit 6b-2 [Sitophilus oryzae]
MSNGNGNDKPVRSLEDPNFKTCLQDARFQNQNATKWCFTMFVDFHKCERLLGEGSDCCGQFKKVYRAICPNEWVQKWEEQIEEGNFPVDLPEKRNK